MSFPDNLAEETQAQKLVSLKGLEPRTILHRAQHAQEGLPYCGTASQLHKGGDALPSRAGVQGLNLTRDQPSQWTPPPTQ